MSSLSLRLFSLLLLLFVKLLFPSESYAQAKLKKVRMGIPATNVAFLPLWSAYHKGFFKAEGIDLEIILMSVPVANTALLTGDIDYHAGVAGLTGAAVRGAPVKSLIFTGDRPLQFLISKKEIKEPSELRGKRIAGGQPGGTTNLMAHRIVKEFGLDPKRDVSIFPIGRTEAEWLAALESGVVDAIVVGVPENVIAVERGYRELAFVGDFVQFPQNGFGTSDKKIRENPDEILRMVRATLRGLMFVWEKSNQDEVLDITTKQWKGTNRKMATEILKNVMRFLTKDGWVKPQEIQVLIDLQKENAKVSRAVSIEEVADPSFVHKAGQELGIGR